MTHGRDAAESFPGVAGAPTVRAARLDPYSIDLVRTSVRYLRGQEIDVAKRFYGHLFSMVPEARRLFPENMGDQHLRLVQSLLATVDGLDDPEEMERRLVKLGAGHSGLGIEEHQFHYVSHALIRAIREIQLAEWSSELSSSWIGLFAWMVEHLVIGFRQAGNQSTPGREPTS